MRNTLPYAVRQSARHTTPITPIAYHHAGFNVRPAQNNNPKMFQAGFGLHRICTPSDFENVRYARMFTGVQPNGQRTYLLDDDEKGIRLARIERELPHIYRKLTVCKSTHGRNRWALFNSPVAMPSCAIVENDKPVFEFKYERGMCNLPHEFEQIIQGDIFALATLTTDELHQLNEALGYVEPSAPAPLKARGAVAFDTETKNPIAQFNQEADPARLLSDAHCSPATGTAWHCSCGMHKNGDSNPSLSVMPSPRYEYVIIGHSPACKYKGTHSPFDFWRLTEGLTISEALKQINPIEYSNTSQAIQKREKRAIQLSAELQQYADRLAQDTGLNRRARELAALLLDYGTKQIVASNAELVDMLRWTKGEAGERMLRRAFEVLKANKYGTRSHGTNKPIVRLPVWTWGEHNSDDLRRTKPRHKNIPQPIEDMIDCDAVNNQTAENVRLKVYKNTDTEAGIEQEKGKEKDIAPAIVYPIFDDNPTGEWASFDPHFERVGLAPLQPYEKPAIMRRFGEIAMFGPIETGDEPQAEQVVMLPVMRRVPPLDPVLLTKYHKLKGAAKKAKTKQQAHKLRMEADALMVWVEEAPKTKQPAQSDLLLSLFFPADAGLPQMSIVKEQAMTIEDAPVQPMPKASAGDVPTAPELSPAEIAGIRTLNLDAIMQQLRGERHNSARYRALVARRRELYSSIVQ